MPLENLHDIIGTLTYKSYNMLMRQLSITIIDRRGTTHDLTAHGHNASLYNGMLVVHNDYRVALCNHDRYGVVICGVERY